MKTVVGIVIASFVSIMAASQNQEAEFNPVVTAVCHKGMMTISVETEFSFHGVVHAKYYRRPECSVNGVGTRNTSIIIDLLAEPGRPNYCGINFNNVTEERSVPIAVRTHKTLELADDKNETSLVTLKLISDGTRVRHTIYGQPYVLQADLSKPDGFHSILVKNCFSFSSTNESVRLTREDGCSERPDIISEFTYNYTTGTGRAEILEMFRFPSSAEVHFQCDILLCRGRCFAPICPGGGGVPVAPQYPPWTNDFDADDYGSENVLMASTTVFVHQPGERFAVAGFESVRSGFSLRILCIVLATLLVVMIVVNVFLCFAMSCSCTRTDISEKEPSIMEDYDPYRDPYKVAWNGSQYGSRYSLNMKNHHHGYTSAGSTMNSVRSSSTNSDLYAIIHSRPGSRFSGLKHVKASHIRETQYTH
ncbi:unnamed protein product [Notodromas monacha]|uniref:ZP domain-containing protein n=1 Tax=Notodromas monacha TaxID=399045 RepID=A0A7R9BWH8_9CRUS|nr:unnamed protein product [Notodromas monacha]CAG0922680.1 unnamed protein product [Notodromas monacha]